MKADIISENEMAPLTVASLPTRPTAPSAFGGRGYTASEMKGAFDKLPRLIVSRLNTLISDIKDGGICEDIPTGSPNLATLSEIFEGIESGSLAAAIKVFDTSLTLFLAQLRRDVDSLLSGGARDDS